MKILSASFRIVFAYFIISFTWILVSDKVIEWLVTDIETLNFLQTIKGWFFITITSIIIYFLIRHYLNKEKNLRSDIEKIFEYSATPIFVFNEDGKILKINSIVEELTQYKYNEIDTINKLISNLLKKENFDEMLKLIESNYKISEKTSLGEFTVKTKDDNSLIWHFDLSPYGLVDNKHILICTCVDISELRKKEALLLQQAKMATMGEMIGHIAHQWKQPISLIKMSNSVIKLKKEDDSYVTQEQEEKAIESIDIGITNLNQTIDDFRNFFNPVKKITQFNILNTFDKTLKLIDSQFNHNNIKLIKQIDDVVLNGLENELLQVLINILKNAKEQLVKKDIKRVLFIKAYKQNNSLVIKIKDNGGGIDQEILNKIFDQYFTTKESEGGSGIGLYISKVIIKEHMKGDISVSNVSFEYENKNYIGAEFIIDIPLINTDS